MIEKIVEIFGAEYPIYTTKEDIKAFLLENPGVLLEILEKFLKNDKIKDFELFKVKIIALLKDFAG